MEYKKVPQCFGLELVWVVVHASLAIRCYYNLCFPQGLLLPVPQLVFGPSLSTEKCVFSSQGQRVKETPVYACLCQMVCYPSER